MKKFELSWIRCTLVATFLVALSTVLLVGVTASASTSSIWADSVSSASTISERAKTHINGSTDCQGLNKILTLGASASGGSPSDTLGELRGELLELDLLAATVKFAANTSNDASAQAASDEAYAQIDGFRIDVSRTLVTKLHYCGNGVEKQMQH